MIVEGAQEEVWQGWLRLDPKELKKQRLFALEQGKFPSSPSTETNRYNRYNEALISNSAN
jgi:hypothetical protein